MDEFERFAGMLIGGAIGDAMGGEFEGQDFSEKGKALFVWSDENYQPHDWKISDDTQLTLATCAALFTERKPDPGRIAQQFLEWHTKGWLSGLGSATLQALQGLQNGGHWALVGKRGEHAAGNGAAMRIAPFAFLEGEIDHALIRDVCRITHHSDEAYVGALAVVLAIKNGSGMEELADLLPDTKVRDRILQVSPFLQTKSINDIANAYGNSGYVVDSVQLAIFAAEKAKVMGFEDAMSEVLRSGGDTDTNASIMGQIAGSRTGHSGLPEHWVAHLKGLPEYARINDALRNWANWKRMRTIDPRKE